LKKIKDKILRFQTARWISQLAFFLLLNAVIFGITPSPIVLPILHSSGTPQKTVGDAFAAIQQLLYEAVFPWLPLAAFLVVAVILGRATCSWVCPFGFLQEVMSYFKRRQMQISPRAHQQLIYVKYAVLAIIVLLSATLGASLVMGVGEGYRSALGEFGNAPFNFLSPADTMFAIIPKMALDFRYALAERSIYDVLGGVSSLSLLFWIRIAILAVVVILAVYIPRVWCRYLCPHGAILAFLNRFSFLGLKREAIKCTKASCRDCVKICPMKVPILDLPWEKFTDPECIYCLKCVDACSTKAIKPKFP